MNLFIPLLFLCSTLLTTAGCAGLTRQGYPPAERQVIKVTPLHKGTFKATLTAWTYHADGTWKRIFGPWPAVIGKNGLAPAGQKREGDGRTPSGTYAIRTAFGTAPALNTGLAYRPTTENDIWVDDSASLQYNRWATLPTNAASFEKMKREDGLYDIGAVIEYNTDPVVPGFGSAIFIHIWRNNGQDPTAGCVALDSQHLHYLLEWLHAGMAPEIVIY